MCLKNPVYTIRLAEASTWFWTIEVHKSGVGITKFRGDAYWQWGSCMSNTATSHVRAKGKAICWSEWLHNTLEGWHSCILHAEGGPFAIHDGHSEYDKIAQLWDLAQLTDREVLEMTGGVLV